METINYALNFIIIHNSASCKLLLYSVSERRERSGNTHTNIFPQYENHTILCSYSCAQLPCYNLNADIIWMSLYMTFKTYVKAEQGSYKNISKKYKDVDCRPGTRLNKRSTLGVTFRLA